MERSETRRVKFQIIVYCQGSEDTWDLIRPASRFVVAWDRQEAEREFKRAEDAKRKAAARTQDATPDEVRHQAVLHLMLQTPSMSPRPRESLLFARASSSSEEDGISDAGDDDSDEEESNDNEHILLSFDDYEIFFCDWTAELPTLPPSAPINEADEEADSPLPVVTIGNMVGCCHDTATSHHACTLCRSTTEGICLICARPISPLNCDPFIVPAFCPSLEAERKALRLCSVSRRDVLRDTLTWFQWRSEYMRDITVASYFFHLYPVLDQAREEINTLEAFEFDGRALAAWRESRFDSDQGRRPRYCSWPLTTFVHAVAPSSSSSEARPRPNLVFYIPTILPPLESFLDYMLTVMEPPPPIVTALKDHIATPTDEWDVPLLPDVGDDDAIRAERARRLERRGPVFSWLERFTHGTLPRLSLIVEDEGSARAFDHLQGHIALEALEPRPDYLLRPHPHYVNVFYIRLAPGAPAVWQRRPVTEDAPPEADIFYGAEEAISYPPVVFFDQDSDSD
jgi:hypothetical protein